MRYLRRIGFVAMAAMTLTAVLGGGSASGTELYKFTDAPANVTQGVNTVIEGSLKSGTSLLLKETFGFTMNTCTNSSIAAKMESPGGEGAHPSGKVSTLTFWPCSNSTIMHSAGSLEIKHIAGTTNGTVTSSGLELTTNSPFGVVNCKTGAGSHFGTLTGVTTKTAHATLDVDAVMDCSGLSSRLTGTYTMTTPTGLNVEAK